MHELTLNNRSIAVTRPLGQAVKLNALIAAAGGNAVEFPLIAIAPLDDYAVFEQTIADLAKYDWLIFISSNAVQNAMPRILAQLGDIPAQLKFAAIGPVTAAELNGFGVDAVLTPEIRFDSEALLALPQMQQVANQRIMIVRGVGGREVLADTLKARGAHVDFAECYQRINPQTDASLLAKLWQNGQLDAVVVTSSEAMRHLLDMVLFNKDLLNKAELSQLHTAHIDNARTETTWIHHVVICVNHARIAELPLSRGLKVAVAETSGDDAMLRCLQQALARPSK